MLTLWDLLDPLLARVAPAAGKANKDKAPKPPVKALVRPPVPRVVTPQVFVSPAAMVERVKPRARTRARSIAAPSAPASANSMQAKYDAVVARMLEEHQIRVRKWRSNMSGVAWYVVYRDGRRVNLIEAPRPRGPMSAAVFLHEIGHHAIGFDVYKPRCLEEFHAWRWSLEAMEAHGLNITDAVRLRVHRSLYYAVAKARRRGIKKIPVELEPFLVKPPSRRTRSGASQG